MNTENLTAASNTAIEAGGTNNTLMGRAMVKRGIMEQTTRPDAAFKFVLTVEYIASITGETVETVQDVADALDSMDEERKFAEAMEREEAEQDTGAYEAHTIAQENAGDRHMEIEALSDEFLTCDAERADEITARLAELGAEPPVLPMSAHVPDAEIAFAEAVDADDTEAQREILNGAAPAVITRDPNEKRYAQIGAWTDENLEVKYGILAQRLGRRTLMKADRMQTERHCQTVENELLARGIRPNRNR